LSFERFNPILELLVQVDDIIPYGAIKAAEFVVCVGKLGLKGCAPSLHFTILRGLHRDEAFENGFQSLGSKQMLLDVGDHEIVEFRHGYVASRAHRFALLMAAAAAVIGIGAITAAGARTSHAGAARSANGKAGQERRAIDDPRWGSFPAKVPTHRKERYLATLQFSGGVSPISRLNASGNQNPKIQTQTRPEVCIKHPRQTTAAGSGDRSSRRSDRVTG